jgi:hypothetical protein
MKKINATLCLTLLGAMSVAAHEGHRSAPHIHVTESVSIGTAALLAIVLTIAGFYFIKKQLRKRNHAK